TGSAGGLRTGAGRRELRVLPVVGGGNRTGPGRCILVEPRAPPRARRVSLSPPSLPQALTESRARSTLRSGPMRTDPRLAPLPAVRCEYRIERVRLAREARAARERARSRGSRAHTSRPRPWA